MERNAVHTSTRKSQVPDATRSERTQKETARVGNTTSHVATVRLNPQCEMDRLMNMFGKL